MSSNLLDTDSGEVDGLVGIDGDSEMLEYIRDNYANFLVHPIRQFLTDCLEWGVPDALLIRGEMYKIKLLQHSSEPEQSTEPESVDEPDPESVADLGSEPSAEFEQFADPEPVAESAPVPIVEFEPEPATDPELVSLPISEPFAESEQFADPALIAESEPEPFAESEQSAGPALVVTEVAQDDLVTLNDNRTVSIYSPEVETIYNTAVDMFSRFITLDYSALDRESSMKMETPPSFEDSTLDISLIALFRWVEFLQDTQSSDSEFKISMSSRLHEGDSFMTCEIYNSDTDEMYQFTYFMDREDIAFSYKMDKSRFSPKEGNELHVVIDEIPLDRVLEDLLDSEKDRN